MSFTPMSRLIMLIVRSPSWPPMPTINPVRTSCSVPKCGKLNRSSQGSVIETASAPNAPPQVLFGLICFAELVPPEELPRR